MVGVFDKSLLAGIADITVEDGVDFAHLTTLRVGGPARAVVRARTTEAVVAVVRALDRAGVELLVVGGGSNLLVADGPQDVVAVVLENTGHHIGGDGLVRAEAGMVWDELVAATIRAGLGGLECLSGIPGSVGATPVQNVGAYGVEVADVFTRVHLYDRITARSYWVPVGSLDLAYRYSNLKFTARAVVLEVEFQLLTDGLSAPLRFADGHRVAPAEARAKVLELRRSKGMVLAADDHDTWSAGSFFTNPVVPVELADEIAAAITVDMPRYPVDRPGHTKLSAAWLIEQSGCAKGFPGEDAPARLSTKHTLALTNRGSAQAADIVALARRVRDQVRDVFGVSLVPEPVWVGVALDEEE